MSAVEQQPSGSTTATPPLGYPDVVLPGAARSGTSFLAASLSSHPAIDGGAVKEPDYFSKHLTRGSDWYDGLFQPRRDGLLRLDASTSYTVPRYPDALERLAEAAPHAYVIYTVRHPLVRAVSHYRLLRDYFHADQQEDFGKAIRSNPVYLGTSDYSRWLPQIYRLWPKERVLIAPFTVTTRGQELPHLIFDQLGLDRVEVDAETVRRHQNEVVTFRNHGFLKLRRMVRRAGAYPAVRRTLGPDRMRALRARMTRRTDTISTAEALESCTPEQRDEIASLIERARSAVSAVLVEQDARHALDWNDAWLQSFESPDGSAGA